jgi:chaperone modulatory protein CbpM
MQTNTTQITEISIVEDEVHMSIIELCHTINIEQEDLVAWVKEGILNPVGTSPEDWRFTGDALSRAKKALRLSRDLEINAPGVAMVLDLLDEILELRKQVA